ncbi:MAG: efflux RND transporter periplasmic adaptor subunit [Thermoanaerobaculia bacterium]|nr:efflux RND transporter periplasmic adaptor subunit [Thermoanaerobaculia bacterium]
MKRAFIALSAAVLFILLWKAGVGGPHAGAAESDAKDEAMVAVEVWVGQAIRHPVAAALWVPGTVVSRNDAQIAAEVAGPLTHVAEVGAVVDAGDILARVDDAALRLRLRADEAEIRRLTAQTEYLDRQLERIDALNREHIATRTQLDELRSQRSMAEQTLESARVARDTTSFLIERSALRAPFAGRVVARSARPGAYVAVGEEVVRVVDTGRVEIRAQAPLQSASHVREGMELTIEVPGRDGLALETTGEVRAAVPVGDERSRMFELRIVPSGSKEIDAAWPVGLPIRVALPAGANREEGPTVSIPRDALVLRRDATYVFVVTGEGTARRVRVETGGGDQERIEITGEVRDGDQVVVRGAERLNDGDRVRIVS